MLRWAVRQDKCPIALRVPSNGVHHTAEAVDEQYAYVPQYQVVHRGQQVAIIAAGSFFQKGENVVRLLAQRASTPPSSTRATSMRWTPIRSTP